MSRHPPGSNPGQAGLPVSMSSTQISTRRQWIAFARLLGPHLPTLPARLTPRTLTTTALDRSSSGWFAASPAGRGRPPDPHGPAPPSPFGARGPRSTAACRPRHPSCPTRAVRLRLRLRPGSRAPSRSSGRAERGSRSDRSTHTFPAGALLDANRNLLEETAVVQTGGERVFDSRSRAESHRILRPRYATALIRVRWRRGRAPGSIRPTSALTRRSARM
jgi:hypothetical protein